MLKSGVFVTPKQTYTVYEIIESGFHRIDFIKGNASFQVDVEAVAYSQVRKKNVYSIGDSEIYDEYLKVKDTIESAYMKTTKEAVWENGVYVTRLHSVNEKLGYTIDSTVENGVTTDSSLTCTGFSIHSFTVDPLYGIKLDPLNFSEYQTVQLSKDTLQADTGSLFYSLDVLKRRYDLRHIEEKDYVVATDIMTAARRLDEFDKNDYPFKGFDTETTGTDVCMYGEDHLVGVILGADPNTATYFPFRHEGDFNLPISFLAKIVEIVIKHQDHSVAHNKKFDREVMLKEGFDIHIKWDSLPISIIINPVLKKGIHGEKNLAYELLGKHFLELDEIFINPKDINFAVLTPDIIKYYACPDGTNVIEILVDQFKKLPKYQYKLAELESDLADVKADQEYYGIRVDVKRFEKQYQNCNYIIDMLLKAFRTLTHEDGNINSPQVLTDLMYNRMHCKVLLRTKTGQASTSSNAIKKLAKVKAKEPSNITEDLVDLNGKVIIKAKDLANSAYPALVILAKYKEYNKLKTAFYSRFERTMKTGRIFFWINQQGAATGRQSSPMHQLPPDLKEVILSDSDDRDFWGPDFSQVELRMIAYLAGETELIELAKDPDNDIHRIIGSLISNKEMWAITPQERSTGKRRNFGVVYLISAMGLAGQIFGPGYTTENVKFCQQQLDAFYHKFKRIDRYIKHNSALVQQRGYMETKWFHRRRIFPEIFDPDLEPQKRASILRMGNNVPVQGTAADYLKVAEVQMNKYIHLKGWDVIMPDGFPRVRMMLSIHDEIIISADNSIPYEEIIEMITKCMETPVEGAPPFFVQPARMANWGEHSDDAVAMPIRYRDQVIEDYNKTGVSVFKQSYFNIIIPDDVKVEVNKADANVSELINKYTDKVTLKFNHGNYGEDFTEEHVKDAFSKYIQSGFTTYRIDNYIDLLNNFRQKKLQDYMDDLIQKYGRDYKVVGEHVRHPSLTHELLNKYEKEIPADMEHVDRITEAARCYIADLESGKISSKLTFKANIVDNPLPATDKELFGGQLEQLVNVDENGDIVYEDDTSEDDDYGAFYDEDPDDIIDRCNNKPQYVWELADTITFDVQDLTSKDVDKVLSYIYKQQRADGFYKITILYNNQIIDTKMRAEEINIEEANNVVISLLPERMCS
jgi:DNA polymerase I-like protein with 3'-5' exonuclease and polymerase domains